MGNFNHRFHMAADNFNGLHHFLEGKIELNNRKNEH